MDYPKSSTGRLAIALLFTGVLALCLTSSPFHTVGCLRRGSEALGAAPRDELDAALRKASTPNKTVIITIVNEAYVEASEDGTSMLDLFLESFWVGEGTREVVDHLLVVAMDQTAYNRCVFRRLNCYKIGGEVDGMEKEKVYMSEGFIRMMWRRTLFLLHVLQRGYSFIFTVRSTLKRHRFDSPA